MVHFCVETRSTLLRTTGDEKGEGRPESWTQVSTAQVEGGDGERVEKARVPSNGWLLPSHRPRASELGPSAWVAFLAVSPCPPSPPGAQEAAPRPSAAQGALAAAR